MKGALHYLEPVVVIKLNIEVNKDLNKAIEIDLRDQKGTTTHKAEVYS